MGFPKSNFHRLNSISILSFASVNMAYFLGPLLGGEIAQYIGFSWLMSLIGCANIGYALFLFISVIGLIYLQVSTRHLSHDTCSPYSR